MSYPAVSPTSRANLLLSASIIALALGAASRPALAAPAPCATTGSSPVVAVCSGDLGSQTIYLDNFGGDITVTADQTVRSALTSAPALVIRGRGIDVDVASGASLSSGIRVEQFQTQSATGTGGIDILFDGEIAQNNSVTGINGINVLAKYGDTRVVTGAGDITVNANQKYSAAIAVTATAPNAGDVEIRTGAGALNARKYGITARGANGDIRITTGTGDITSKYGINASTTNGSGDITVTTGAGAIDANKYGVRALSTTGNITITGGAGTISGDRGGILARSASGAVAITTGSGAISTGGYGINSSSTTGAITITTGSGAVAGDGADIVAMSDSGPITIVTGDGLVGRATSESLTRDEGIRAVSGRNGRYGDVTITVGSGGVRASYGIQANGANTDITVNGDITTNNTDREIYAAGIISSAFGSSGLPTVSRVAYANDGVNRITVNAGATIDASNGVDAIRTKYGATEIVVAGTVIGGSDTAIQTNVVRNVDDQAASTRIELQDGYDITGAVIAGSGGGTDQDVLALGGEDMLTFDLSKVGTAPFIPPVVMPQIGMVAEEAPQFFGFETFEKVSGGTAVLTGANAAVDNFAVRAGTLQLSGVQADAMAVDLIGGTLAGDGTIGSLNAGSGTTVAPGADGAASVIAARGDVTFAAGSTLSVDLRDDGEADRIDAGGAALIDTDTAIEVTAQVGDYSAPDLDWTVLTAQDGVTGTFGGVTDTLIDVDFDDVYDAGAVRLVATVAETPVTPVDPEEPEEPGAPEPTGPTETPTPTTPPVPGGGVSDKANGPASGVSAGNSSLNFAANLIDVSGQDDQDQSGAASTDQRAFISTMGTASGLSTLGEMNTSVFVGTYTERADYGASAGVSAFDTETTGLAGGVSFADRMGDATSYRINVGLGLGATFTGTAQGAADATNFDLGIGGTLDNGPWRLSGALGLTWADIDLSRRVGAATATANTDARGLSGLVEASYDVAARAGLPEGTTLAPLARLKGYSVTVDGYSETGAGAVNLDVAETSADALYAGVGLRYAGRHEAGGMTLRPSLSVVYDTLLSGGDTTSVATIAGVAGAFETTVNAGPDNRLSIDGGVAFDLQSNVEGYVTFGTTVGEDFDSQRGAVGLTIKF